MSSTAHTILLTALLLSVAGHCGAVAGPEEEPVTLSLVGAPLTRVLSQLSTESEKYVPASDLAEVKLTVIVSRQPRATVLAQVARVLGAQFRPKADSPATQELRRRRDVSEWVERWKRARRSAEKSARELQESKVREHFRKALSQLDRPFPRDENGNIQLPNGLGPLPLARFARLLPDSDFEAVVRHVAAVSPLREGGDALPLPPPIARPFKAFSPEAQRLLAEFVSAGSPPDSPLTADRVDHLHDAVVTVGSDGAAAMDIHILWPSGNRMDGYAVSGAYSGKGMELHLHRHMFAELAKERTPEAALLGAQIIGSGEVRPAPHGLVNYLDPWVRVSDSRKAAERLAALEALASRRDPLRSEFLVALSKTGLNVVADHHTRSERLRRSGGDRFDEILKDAAASYDTIFVQDGGFLLARSAWWPDRDEEETPAPHPETWIRTKQQGGGLTLDDLGVLSRLSEPRLDGLNAYRDGLIHFQHEVRLARRHRWVWTLAASLSGVQRRLALSAEGLPVARLDLRKRALLQKSIPFRGPWDQVRLRIWRYGLPDGALGSDLGSHYAAQLFVPGATAPLWSTD